MKEQIEEMTKKEKEILLAYAENNMNTVKAARSIYCHHNTICYHLTKIKEKYGLDPRKFYDLVELLETIKGGQK